MSTWIEAAGYPVVALVGGNGTFAFASQRYFAEMPSNASTAPSNQTWWLPITVRNGGFVVRCDAMRVAVSSSTVAMLA